jgi:hypothetical protein
MKFLDKIRNSPDNKKKIIIWSIVIFLGIALSLIWIKISLGNIKDFRNGEFLEDFGIEKLKEDIRKDFPGIELSEDLKDIDISETPQM